MFKLIARFITLVVLSLFVVSCGSSGPSVLSNVQVEQKLINDDLWIFVTSDINLANMSFGSIALPIPHPHGQTPIGQVELVSGIGGVNQLKISVNTAELADTQTGQALLPNGNMVPLIANNPAISVEIGNGGKLYLLLTDSITVIGVAMPIREMDSIGSQLPGLNFFPIVQSNNVTAAAGIYTGARPGQNGIAVIADVTNVVKQNNDFLAQPSMAIQDEEIHDSIKLDYRSHSGTKAQREKLERMLLNLNKRRVVLRVR